MDNAMKCSKCNGEVVSTYTQESSVNLRNVCAACFRDATGFNPTIPKRFDSVAPEYYRKLIGGILCDPYRLAKLLGITDHAIFQIFKKSIRAGNKPGNTARKEMEDIRDAAVRWLEMDDEDVKASDHYSTSIRTKIDARPQEVGVGICDVAGCHNFAIKGRSICNDHFQET